MESLKLKQVARKLKRKEIKLTNAKFNFGKTEDGNIITSTSNAKAHTYNKLIRESNRLRDLNFQGMLKAFESGEVSNNETKKVSKGHRNILYKKSINAANDTRLFIEQLAKLISLESNGRPVYLCQSK
jgi:uncharacterized protein YdaT